MYSFLKRSVRLALPLLLFSSITLSAKVTMCSVFGDHMVLQRAQPIPVFGSDTPGEQITVTLGADTASTVADSTGYWQVALPARSASTTPTVMTVVGSSAVTFNDVLVGEVWIAGGQSNMDWAFFWGNGILDWLHTMYTADYPMIRSCKVITLATPLPQDSMKASWIVCTPKIPGSKEFSSGIESFTCTGYFFALKIYQSLGVPVGLINSSDGGTTIEAWMDPVSVAEFPDVAQRWQAHEAAHPAAVSNYQSTYGTWQAERNAALYAGQNFDNSAPVAPLPLSRDVLRPSGLFNAMINPFLGYGVRGVIWYQGENNVTRAAEYRSLFPALIQGWRAGMGQGNIPFYWAQLSNYNYSGQPNGTNWAFLREAQNMTLSVPNTGQAITYDIGLAGNVHLADKEDVGRRLALLALNETYHISSVAYSGPVFDHATLNGNTYQVYFQNAPGGLVELTPELWQVPAKPALPYSELGGFQMAGADQVFYPAVAQFSTTRDSVLVTCSAVPNPVALRYGFVNNPVNLRIGNAAGLPAGEFRTDNWPENPAETTP